ncbi:lipid kinase [Azospirillum halopraeferens]|uniref:lipid kinase n=1 Tax=Azospirillum halopraeferens TaxID=34010 RepID=UPI0004108882|nr:lipid kinase [Azospirillum halopraeferens]
MTGNSDDPPAGGPPGGSARRALLLVNRHARNGTADLDAVRAALAAAGVAVEERDTARKQPIPDLIRRHGPGYDCVIVGGGDGTLNAVAPALRETGLTLGVLPLGTANDLARSLGIPADPLAAARIIAHGHVHTVDLGEVNGHLFWNVASLGMSVDLARTLSTHLKKRWGRLGYALAGLRILRRMRPFSAEIVTPEGTRRVRTVQIAVGNGRHYGGGLTVEENASLDDGLLHVYSLEIAHWWELLRLLPAFRNGRHGTHRGVRAFACDAVEIRTRRPQRVNTDGEVSTTTPARFRVLRGAVRVYTPAAGPPGGPEG